MSRLIDVRAPTPEEAKERGGMIVFERMDSGGRKFLIFASCSPDGWQQWGETTPRLSENVEAVEVWWREGMAALWAMVQDEDADEDEEG